MLEIEANRRYNISRVRKAIPIQQKAAWPETTATLWPWIIGRVMREYKDVEYPVSVGMPFPEIENFLAKRPASGGQDIGDRPLRRVALSPTRSLFVAKYCFVRAADIDMCLFWGLEKAGANWIQAILGITRLKKGLVIIIL